MAKLDDLFKIMVDKKASDLHLTSGAAPCFRIDGDIQQLEYRELNSKECQALIFEILSDKQKASFMENWELDCSYTLENIGRFRCNIFMQRKGIGAVFRSIPEKVLSMEDLSLPPIVKSICQAPKGLVLVTGPTGSGKSTTLAAMIDYINASEPLHILTIEDPIEFVHQNKQSLVNQREVNGHTKSFNNALRASLREDPDVILVGEMRDLETIELAITAAETGHLVFGTLHTMSAPKTIDRIIDVFPEERQMQIRMMLSESLNAVISQKLLPHASGKGRVAALEILINTNAVSNLIREGKTFQIVSSMQTGRSAGMQTFDDHLKQLADERKITQQIANLYVSKAKASTQTTSSPVDTVTKTNPSVKKVG